MPFAIASTVGDGSTNIVSVPFPYIAQADVHFYANGVEVPASTLVWLTVGTVQLPLPAGSYSGVVVLRKRITPATLPIVVYRGGGLDYNDLNASLLQLLYANQEAQDIATVSATASGYTSMSQIKQGLADPLSAGYDPTFKVASNIPAAVPPSPVEIGWNASSMILGSQIYYFIMAQLGLSVDQMGAFVTDCLKYPVAP